MNAYYKFLRSNLLIAIFLVPCLAGCTAPFEPATTPPRSTLQPTTQSPGQETPPADDGTRSYSTLAQGYSMTGGFQTPTIMVASSLDETSAWSGWLSNPKEIEAVQAVDFDKNWIVAVFRGELGNACFGIEIHQVLPQEGQVLVAAENLDPKADQACSAVISYPYHIVAVPRDSVNANERTPWILTDLEEQALSTAIPIE